MSENEKEEKPQEEEIKEEPIEEEENKLSCSRGIRGPAMGDDEMRRGAEPFERALSLDRYIRHHVNLLCKTSD